MENGNGLHISQHIPLDRLKTILDLYRLLDRIEQSKPEGKLRRGRPRGRSLRFLIYALFRKLLIECYGNEDEETHEIDQSRLEYTSLIGNFLSEQEITHTWRDGNSDDRQGLRQFVKRLHKNKGKDRRVAHVPYRDIIPLLLLGHDNFISFCEHLDEPLAFIMPEFYKYSRRYLQRYHHKDPRTQLIIKAFEVDSFSVNPA